MIKLLRSIALVFCVCLMPSVSHAGDLENGFATLWESLWFQGGAPVLLHRWDGIVRYRFFGVNIEFHRKHFEKILSQTSTLTSIKFEDVSGQSDAKEKAQFHVEIVANSGDIPERLACYVKPLKATNFKFDLLELRMRDNSVYGCNLHEMMHAMGIYGHPSGDTVLTYFNTRADKFLPLDEFLLTTLYSAAITPGMTPFQTIDVLTHAWAEKFAASRPDALEAKQSFLKKTISEMEKLASGSGELPRILIRSGMLDSAMTAQAKIDMNWMLGFSYQHGHIVKSDLSAAERWYQSGASRGNSPSMYLLGVLNERRARIGNDYIEQAYYWHTVATAYKHPSATVARNRLAAKLAPELVAKLDAEAANFKPTD
jgi:hypothetical protein